MAARHVSTATVVAGGADCGQEAGEASGLETAKYVGDLAGELADIAAAAKMEIVASLLRFAQIECQMIASRNFGRRAAGPDQ